MKVRLVTSEGHFVTQLSFEQASEMLHNGQARVYALYPYAIQVKRSAGDVSTQDAISVVMPEGPTSAQKQIPLLPLVSC